MKYYFISRSMYAIAALFIAYMLIIPMIKLLGISVKVETIKTMFIINIPGMPSIIWPMYLLIVAFVLGCRFNKKIDFTKDCAVQKIKSKYDKMIMLITTGVIILEVIVIYALSSLDKSI